MNELIKKLKEQAKEVSHWLDGGYTPVYYTNLEKFAELIVKECADFADEHNSEVEGVTLGVGKAIKQHFGVEELNEALKALAVEAGAPEDMLNKLWFNVFCQKFAHLVAEDLSGEIEE